MKKYSKMKKDRKMKKYSKMKKYKIWQPIATSFAVEINAENEDKAIELFEMGVYNYSGINEQIVDNQQPNGAPEIMAEEEEK